MNTFTRIAVLLSLALTVVVPGKSSRLTTGG
jgi:hypothetical protein